ncbi:hypothetical protein AMECASPLE_033104, partial [Ameca splendens]
RSLLCWTQDSVAFIVRVPNVCLPEQACFTAEPSRKDLNNTSVLKLPTNKHSSPKQSVPPRISPSVSLVP